MKWIGQHIYDLVSRFRDDVYLEDLSTTTETSVLVVDSTGKVSKSTTLADDIIESEIDTLAGLTSFGAAGATTNIAAGDLTMYDATGTEANPTISLGSSATNRLEIKAAYNSGSDTLCDIDFTTFTTSGTANDGRFNFYVDEVQAVNINDGGLYVYGGGNIQASSDGATLSAYDTTTSSATEGGRLRLMANDGAVMGDNHRLGVIEFYGAEDGVDHLSIGARIQAICRDAWDGSNNDADLEFYTTDGTTESKVLTLDADKLATFAGAVTVTGALTGTLATVSQPNITGVGTIGTGAWRGSVIESAYLDADTAHLAGTQTFSGAKTFSAATTTFTSATADSPIIKVLNTTDDDQAGQLIFEKLRDDDAVASGQNLGEIWFRGQDSAQNTEDYAYIVGEVDLSTGGQESGQLVLGVASDNGANRTGLKITGGDSGEADVVVGLGAASVTTISGTLTMGSTAAMTNAGLLSVANQTGITGVGTISSGEWEGTQITHAYINPDQRSITGLGTIASGAWQGDPIASAYIADDAVTFAKASGVTPNVFGSVIKLIPSDFMANDDGGNTKFGIGYVETAGSTYGMRAGNSLTELYAFVSIPEGMTATHVDIFDKNDVGVIVYEAQINATTMVSKGTGNCNTTVDITDVASTAKNFLAIQVTTTSVNDKVYGGIVTIA